ncbi:MAG: cephalosporin hydroxylase family protein [Nitratireductor sp.]
MDHELKFKEMRAQNLENYSRDTALQNDSSAWRAQSMEKGYVYNFDWLGRPIIQYPQDIQAVQEIVWQTKPDLIIETGIAHGGSLILSASMLAMLDLSEAIENKTVYDPTKTKRKVVGIDIDIRSHNRQAIEAHPMNNWITMIEGSAIAEDVVQQVQDIAKDYTRVMVCLDSMHTHDHVLSELQAYAPLVSSGCYCVVFDTFVDDLKEGFFKDRPWDVGNNPKTAVKAYLENNNDFSVDLSMDQKLQITVAPHGFLKKK